MFKTPPGVNPQEGINALKISVQDFCLDKESCSIAVVVMERLSMSDLTTGNGNFSQRTVDLNPYPKRDRANLTQLDGDSRPGRIFELEKPWLEPQNNGGAK